MTPIVVIIGRPNAGKSTLFNRLTGKRLALVEPTPGLTRDWREEPARLGRLRFRLRDTPGLEESAEGTVEAAMRRQTERALADADLALLLFDARTGLTPLDRHFAQWLRETGKPVILIANKCEGQIGKSGAVEGYALGWGAPLMVSAEHGDGMGALHDALAEAFLALAESGGETSEEDPGAGATESRGVETGDVPDEEEERGPLKLAIAGRPNVGKSTLVNRLIGEERLLTGPEPGMTRDAIAIDWSWKGRAVRLVDTAGLRRRAQVTERLERMSAAETARAIRLAEVVVLVIDATVMLERQDLSIARHVVEEGRALVICANKWDLVDDPEAQIQTLRHRLEQSLPQSRGVAWITVSALTGQNLDLLMKAVLKTHGLWNRRIGTGALNRWFAEVQEAHPPPAVSGRRLKLRYLTQVKARPPTFVLFTTRPEAIPASYLRYLENALRDRFGLGGVPLRILLRAGKNPYHSKRQGS